MNRFCIAAAGADINALGASVSQSHPHNLARKLVVVDDEKAFTNLLEAVLSESLACPVVTFNSPLEALAYVRAEQIGMLITDYHMPSMDGIKLAQMVNELQPDVPILIITGHNLGSNRATAESIPSLKAIIQKPFGLRELKEAISRHWVAGHGPVIKS